jgi:hypothetical protein
MPIAFAPLDSIAWWTHSSLDLAQTAPARSVFIDNTPLFVQIAERMGMQSILHTDFESTRAKLALLGFQTNDAP